MSASKPVSLNVTADRGSSDIKAVAAEMENVLAVLASEWSMEEELADSEVELLIGADSPKASEEQIQISDPENYDRMVRDQFPDGPMKSRALGFEGPYHEMFEEAGHYLSEQPVDRPESGYENVVAKEFLGGLGIETFDPEVVMWELGRAQRNLEAVHELTSDEHIDYIDRNSERIENLIFTYASQLDEVETEQDIKNLFQDARGDMRHLLENRPEQDVDYSRSGGRVPASYSEWMVNGVAFNFLDPLEAYFRGEEDYETAVEEARALADRSMERLDEHPTERDSLRVKASELDRAYFTARSLASGGVEDYSPEELVRMNNGEIYDEFSDRIEATDSRLRTAYDITQGENL